MVFEKKFLGVAFIGTGDVVEWREVENKKEAEASLFHLNLFTFQRNVKAFCRARRLFVSRLIRKINQ